MFSVYFHIPYCLSKCAYCDFYSLGRKDSVPPEYVSALIKEVRRHNIKGAKTIYFGGGTPSLLTPTQVSALIDACTPETGAEITLEANPDAVTESSLKGFKAAGVNRLSIGVQTASDESLARLARRHTAADAVHALSLIEKAGFINISGDIMLALPHYTRKEFDDTLSLLKNSGVTHISSYILKIEQRTAFGKNPPKGLPSDDEAAEFYLYAQARLQQEGFAQYEISNFAKIGFEGQHNLAYWNCLPYIGIGAAAHSCIADKRFYYSPSVSEFVENPQIIEDGTCTAQDYIMLRLRLNAGLEFAELKRKFHAEFTEKQMKFLQKCESANYATLTPEKITLTPKGMLIQNSILRELL